jgi:hypothetical protein
MCTSLVKYKNKPVFMSDESGPWKRENPEIGLSVVEHFKDL